MPATLYFSNSPDVLLERLADNLEWADPFLSPRIATPTAAMKRWVQLRLADRLGIVANVDFLHLERTLWKRLEDLDQEHVALDRRPARLLDEQGLQILILGMLRRDPPEEVRAYLEEAGAGSQRDGLRARRLIQLSRKLAGFFREYEYSRVQEHGRKGLAYLWKHGEDCFRDYLDAKTPKWRRQEVERLERWQKALYHGLFRPGGLRDGFGRVSEQYAYTLPQYAEMVLAQPRATAPPQSPPAYHLFGLSQISPFHRSLIRRLADPRELPGREATFHIYSLNPCAEYWEDLLTPGERRHRQQEDLFRRQKYQDWRKLEDAEKDRLKVPEERIQAEDLHLEEENALLSLWGKPGRENIQLWLQLTDYDFLGQFREAEGGSLLAAARNAVLGRRGALPPEERAPQDGSLQILACPEIHREVETVHDGIVEALLEDPALRPDEIAVLVPDMAKYRDVLAAVFGRSAEGESGHVPYNLSDATASAESDYAKGVAALFDLARGRFSRRDLFALAANPCFRGGFGLDEETLRVWGRWADRLGVFHGFDAEDKRRRGYSADLAHTWSHGLERLVLGTVMETPPSGDPRHFAGLVPYADGDTADQAALQPFLVAVEGLHRDLAAFRDGRERSWEEWIDRLSSLLDRYLVPPEDQPLEAYVQAEMRRHLLEMRGLDALEGLTGVGGAGPSGIPADLPMGLLLERLQGLKAGREPHLAGGVNVSALSALRSLPFKLVYVLGLGEGEFPEDDASSTLDLRAHRRVIGDVDPAARNRYLFLELLACATGRLRLSWVCRDVRQGKPIQMSSVLGELADWLERCVLAEEDGKPARFRITQAPLLSRSPALFAGGPRAPWDPPLNRSREERLLAWLERKETEFRSAPRPVPWPGYARRELPPDRAREVFPPSARPALAEGGEGGPYRVRPGSDCVAVPLDDVRLYLENPASHALRRWFGIRDWREEDARAAEDEPFFCPFPHDVELVEAAVHGRLADWESPSRAACRPAFDEHYDRLGLRGRMPAGPYRDLDREALWTRADSALASLEGFLDPRRPPAPGARIVLGAAFGEGRSRSPSAPEPELQLPPVRLEVEGRAVELHGHLPFLILPEAGGCEALVFQYGDFDRRRLLPAFLFGMAGALSDSPLGERLRAAPFKVHYLARKYSRYAAVENWPPFRLDPDASRRYLGGLLARMLRGPDFDHLPFEAVSDVLAPKGRLLEGKDYAAELRRELEGAEEAEEFGETRSPGDALRILDPKVPDDAEAKIRARLSPFFNWRDA